MKQYVSRGRGCWTLLVQMDPVIHLSEGHRSDMLLDLSGLTREERIVVQASTNKERYFDRVAAALTIQHPRIHLRERQKRRVRAKMVSNVETIQTSVGFGERSRVKHVGSGKPGKSGASAYYASYTSVEDYDYDDDAIESADAYQAHNDPVDPGSDDEEALHDVNDEEYETFSSYVALDDDLLWRQLNWMRLLFLPTRGTMISILKRVHSWYKQMYKLTFLLERRKARAKARARVKANVLFARHTCHWRTVVDD